MSLTQVGKWPAYKVNRPLSPEEKTGQVKPGVSVSEEPLLYLTVLPMIFLEWLGRLLIMATCKISVWPDWVEQECRIEPNDPYIRDASQDQVIEPFTKIKEFEQ